MEDKFEFTENGHSYTLNGKKLTGVTTVIGVVSKGDGLIQWSANEAVKFVKESDKFYLENGKVSIPVDDFAQILEQAKTAWKTNRDTAGDKGKDIHAIIEILINEAIQKGNGFILPIVHDSEQVNHFIKWAVENNIKFLESEKKVYSKTHWLAGTVDFVYEKNGDVYVGDVKTAKTIYPTNFWQTSAYKMMLEELGLYKDIKGFTIVRLGKDGSFEVKENFSYEDNISGFLSALNIYRKLNLITPPKKSYYKSNKKTITV